MRKFDKLLIFALLFGFIGIWLIYFVNNIFGGLFISLLVSITLLQIINHFYLRRKITSEISVEQMNKHFALMGLFEQAKFMETCIPSYFTPQCEKDYVIFTRNLKKFMLFCNIKFSTSSADEIGKAYRIAKEQNITHIYVLSLPINRNLQVFCSELDIKISFITGKQLHSYLNKQNKLPAKTKSSTKKEKPPFKETLLLIFAKQRAKYFFTTGSMLCLLSLISPLKLYYLVGGSLGLILGAICYFLPEPD